MKINNATSLLELQILVRDLGLDIHINYVGSAACWRAVVVGPSKEDPTEPKSATGIGRNLGEAMSNAFHNYDNHIFQERSR